MPIRFFPPCRQSCEPAIDSWTTFHSNIVKAICWRWGVPMDKPSGLAEANKGFTFDPAQITAPVLLIVGEGEYRSEEVQRQQQIILANLPNPNKKMGDYPNQRRRNQPLCHGESQPSRPGTL